MSNATPKIEYRFIETFPEILPIEEMQARVWGVSEIEVVPASMMIAAITSGGVLVGAYDADKLIGFTFGFGGFEKGMPVHHSHMLAVAAEYRGFDIGKNLKLKQRERVVKMGIEVMTWTFDPLQSLNAYFNFQKLGVVSDSYMVDFYGDVAESFLHQNGTDRLWVEWHLNKVKSKDDCKIDYSARSLNEVVPLISKDKNAGIKLTGTEAFAKASLISIEVPKNIAEIEADNFELAKLWRVQTRKAFQEAFAQQFYVSNFIVNKKAGFYLLKRK